MHSLLHTMTVPTNCCRTLVPIVCANEIDIWNRIKVLVTNQNSIWQKHFGELFIIMQIMHLNLKQVLQLQKLKEICDKYKTRHRYKHKLTLPINDGLTSCLTNPAKVLFTSPATTMLRHCTLSTADFEALILRTYVMSVSLKRGNIFWTNSTTSPTRKAWSTLLGLGPPENKKLRISQPL